MLIRCILLLGLLVPSLVFSQLQRIPISGTIQLDQGAVSADTEIEINFDYRNLRISSFDFRVSYPIFRTVSSTIVIPAGKSSATFNLSPFFLSASRYSIRATCSECTFADFPVYVTPSGLSTTIREGGLLERGRIPSRSTITLKTFSSVSGTVAVENHNETKKDLLLSASIFDGDSNSLIKKSFIGTIRKGESSTSYSIKRIPRVAAPLGYRVQLSCDSGCGTDPLLIDFPRLIDSGSDQTEVDFLLPATSLPLLAPVYDLLFKD